MACYSGNEALKPNSDVQWNLGDTNSADPNFVDTNFSKFPGRVYNVKKFEWSVDIYHYCAGNVSS